MPQHCAGEKKRYSSRPSHYPHWAYKCDQSDRASTKPLVHGGRWSQMEVLQVHGMNSMGGRRGQSRKESRMDSNQTFGFSGTGNFEHPLPKCLLVGYVSALQFLISLPLKKIKKEKRNSLSTNFKLTLLQTPLPADRNEDQITPLEHSQESCNPFPCQHISSS